MAVVTFRCARCGRRVAKPILLAGVRLGPTCIRRVEGYIAEKKAPRVEPQPVDERQLSMFTAEAA